jgi:glycosyltransferase involved in cell wall biosynthesis
MARALVQALAGAGIAAEVASTLQSRDPSGDPDAQARLMEIAASEVARLIPEGRAAGWRFWLTYHNYYKAPDLIGPGVSAALDIPYLLVEATRARKRLGGPWDAFAKAAEAATEKADTVFYLTEHDAEALRAYAPDGQRLVHLRPFLARTDMPPCTTRQNGILAVGMFRAGDKTASYQLIAEALGQLGTKDWSLGIAGDGVEAAKVRRMMQGFNDRVRFLGALDAEQMQAAYGRCSLLFWPGVNEAFGMTYIEAQAAGLPVVAQDRPGVRDVLSPDAAYPSVEGGAKALAARLDLLLSMPKLTQHLGMSARDYVARHHLMSGAEKTLAQAIAEVTA